MIPLVLPCVPPSYFACARNMLKGVGRKLLGWAGPPAAGKSTLALAFQAAFADVLEVVSMEGFHLASVELHRLRRAGHKSASDTVDAAGYVALMRRLRRKDPGETIYAPEFGREIEEAVAGAIPIHPQAQLEYTEGNHRLFDIDPLTETAALLDDACYVYVDDELRGQRLVTRQKHFGRSRQAAIDWLATTDEINAKRITTTKPRAQLIFQWD